MIDMLIANDYIEKNERVSFSVRALGNWGVLAFVAPKRYYHIKINVTGELTEEYKHLKRLIKLYADYVPYPLDYVEHENVEYMICQAYEHQVLTPRLVRSNKKVQTLLNQYFMHSITHWKQNKAEMEIDSFTIDILKSIENDDLLTDEYRLFMQQLDEKIQTIGFQYQHGDFVLNNVALTGDSMIIFDWEDYAKVVYPGFDLAIWLHSLYNFQTTKLVNDIKNTTNLDVMIKSYLDALDLSKDEFIKFFPLYLYLFMKLKSQFGYSQDVVSRTHSSFIKSLDMMKEAS